jgi:hypothetical protein
MTGTKSKFRSKFRFRLYSGPATGRNFSGISNLDDSSIKIQPAKQNQSTHNSSHHPPNPNHNEPTKQQNICNTASGGADPGGKDDKDEEAGYAGYYHYELWVKKIANIAREHWTWREHGYNHVRDFEDIYEAMRWMNDDEDVLPLEHHPMPESNRISMRLCDG